MTVKKKLIRLNIPFVIRDINGIRFNVFFGDQNCIDVLIKIGDKSLSTFTDEEDFILGAMLGYDISQQCKRFIVRKNKTKALIKTDKTEHIIRAIV